MISYRRRIQFQFKKKKQFLKLRMSADVTERMFGLMNGWMDGWMDGCMKEGRKEGA